MYNLDIYIKYKLKYKLHVAGYMTDLQNSA